MLSKRILVLVSLLLVSFLMVGCDWFTPPVIINYAPVITSEPVTTATVGVEYTYDVDATDDDTLTYSLVTKLDGMTINPVTGLIKWTPVATQVGYNTVEVEVSDRVESVFQSFTVNVTARIPMTITVDLPTTFTVGESTWFTVTMEANSDVGKEVVVSFSGDTEILKDLEIEEGSGLNFDEDVFILPENATAHFRGTFDEAGTYSTTIKVKTSPGGVWLCSKKITIVVKGLVVTQDSGKNDENREWNEALGTKGPRPYINWKIDGLCIEFEFVNPTIYNFAFDYRVDGEEGTIGEWSSTIISGGELDGEEIGPSYNIVNMPLGEPGLTKTVTVCVEEEVWVGLRLGAENDWYLDWIKFEVR